MKAEGFARRAELPPTSRGRDAEIRSSRPARASGIYDDVVWLQAQKMCLRLARNNAEATVQLLKKFRVGYLQARARRGIILRTYISAEVAAAATTWIYTK